MSSQPPHYLHRIGATSISAIGGSLGGDAVGNAEAQSPGVLFDKMVFLGSEGGDNPEKLKGRKLSSLPATTPTVQARACLPSPATTSKHLSPAN